MSITVTWTCDYDGGCDRSASMPSNHELQHVERSNGMVSTMPLTLATEFRWCRYEPEKHPEGQILCREHREEVRLRTGVRLIA